MSLNFQFIVEESKIGLRLDIYLKEKLPSLSRSRLQDLIEQGKILVNLKPQKASYRVKKGDVIIVDIPPESPLELTPQEVPFEILFEDEDIAVIYKPPKIVVHPAPGHREKTLVHGLLLRLKGLSGIGGKLRPGIVHRLDKDTSGLMIVAKNDFSHQALVQAFKERIIKKTYLALLYGHITPKTGTIEKPIGRHPKLRKKMAVLAEGKPAVTEYEVIRYFKKASYVQARPITGRTHQLRVHFSYLGHPILGDPLYGGLKPDIPKPSRLMLHAWKISFPHPKTKTWLSFEKEPPPDFIEYLKNLEENA